MDRIPKNKLIFYFLSITILVLLLLGSLDAGISGDEYLHLGQSERVTKYFTSFGKDKSAVDPPIADLKYYGQSFDNITTIVSKIFNIEDIFTLRHLSNSFIGWAIIFISGLTAVIFGGYRAGIICLILLSVSPRLIGHSFNNLKDIPFAFSYIFSIYCMIKFFRLYPKINYKNCLLLILAMAFSISIRIGGFVLICYFALFSFMVFIQDSGKLSLKAISQYIIPVVAISIFAFLLGLILWPYAIENPIKNTWISYKVMTKFPTSLRQIFEGQVFWSEQLPWYYLLKYMLITIPLVVFAGFIAFALFLKKLEIANSGFMYILFFSLFFPIIFVLTGASNLYGGWRHLIFVYPPLVIIASVGYNLFFEKLKKTRVKISVVLIFVLLLIHPVKFMANNHPYQYLYYNQITGGLKGAYTNYESDYYYHSAREASEWLKQRLQKEKKEKVVVASNFAIDWFFKDISNKVDTKYTRYYSRGQYFWDYIIICNSYIHPYQLRNEIWPPPNTIYKVEAEGIPICAVIKRVTYNDYEGSKLLEEGKYNEAVEKLKNALIVDPYSEIAYLKLAKSYIKLDSLEQANEVLNQCDKIYPGYERIWYYRAKIYEKNNETDKAILSYKKAINKNFKYFPSYTALSDLFFKTGKENEAKDYLKKCIKVNHLYKPALQRMGNYYEKKGLDKKAQKYFDIVNRLSNKK